MTKLNDYTQSFTKFFNDAQTEVWLKEIIDKIKCYQRTIWIGNGGSLCICAHMAEDFAKMACIPSLCMTNPGLITCLANDEGYENVYRNYLDIHYQRDDLVFAISSSGRSTNIIRGAKMVGSHNLITFTGFDEDNPLRKRGDINVYVPSHSYGIVESIHATFLHLILDKLVEDSNV